MASTNFHYRFFLSINSGTAGSLSIFMVELIPLNQYSAPFIRPAIHFLHFIIAFIVAVGKYPHFSLSFPLLEGRFISLVEHDDGHIEGV